MPAADEERSGQSGLRNRTRLLELSMLEVLLRDLCLLLFTFFSSRD